LPDGEAVPRDEGAALQRSDRGRVVFLDHGEAEGVTEVDQAGRAVSVAHAGHFRRATKTRRSGFEL